MSYDCIIIGGGMSGLVAATSLQAQGNKTLLIEKEARVGGYFSGFENEAGDRLDYAISYVLSCGEGDVLNEFLKKIGLDQKIKFHRLQNTDDIYMAGRHITFGEGRENFKETLYREFPESKEQIDDLMNWLIDYQEGIAVQGSKAMQFFMQYFKKDYEDFLNTKITDETLKGLLALRIQADPASLMIMAGFLVECYFKGMYYPEGGSYHFVEQLVDFYKEKGGEVITREEICSFHCEEQKVVSVTSVSGKTYKAQNYIFNGDVIKLNMKFLEGERKGTTLKKLSQRVIGHSSIDIYLTVRDYDLSKFQGGRVYLTKSEKIFDTYREVESGQIPKNPVIKLHFPCHYDNTLTKDNRQIIRIETDICYDESKDTEEKYLRMASEIMQYVEETILPEISKYISYIRIITPVEFAKMFGHTHGSGTGWAHTTYNMMVSKYTQNTECSNLFIAGQWGEFGSGLRQLVLSGEKAADMVRRRG